MSASTPSHIAIICDGNRRWARAQGLSVLKGHQRAVNEVFEPLIDAAAQRGIEYLTFWIFSTENWQRDPIEVKGLMDLFRSFFDRQVKELHKKNVRVNMIGDITKFDQDIQERIRSGLQDTKDNTGVTVTLAMNYGSRDEIVRAARRVVKDVKSGKLSAENIDAELTEDVFASYLDTADMPDPELIVRPGGEQRLSGFLAWQMQYSEFYFAPWMFPEFTPEKLDECLEVLASRGRRFGK